MIQNVFPLVIIALSLAIARALQDVPNPPPLELSPYTFFSKAEYNYLFVGGYQGNETQSYFDSAFQPCGVGGHWLGSGGDPSSVCYDDPSHDPNLCDNTTEYLCTCPRNECNDTTPFPDHISCYNGTGSGTRLQDVSVPLHPLDSEYANDALTTYLLRSKNSFIEQRYGGFSFGHTREEVAPVVDEDNMAANVTQPFLATREAAKVWYTLKGYHAMPSVLNAMNNVLLRANLDHGENNTKYGECLVILGLGGLCSKMLSISQIEALFCYVHLCKFTVTTIAMASVESCKQVFLCQLSSLIIVEPVFSLLNHFNQQNTMSKLHQCFHIGGGMLVYVEVLSIMPAVCSYAFGTYYALIY